MLDIRLIRQNADAINTALKKRDINLSIDEVLKLDQRRLPLLQEEESLRSERNKLIKTIGQLRGQGKIAEAEAIQAETKAMGDRVTAIEAEKEAIEAEQMALIKVIPNTPFDDVPVGTDETQNIVIKTWGNEYKDRPAPDAMAHYDVGPLLGMIDFERGVKIAQSRFYTLTGHGAKLERALIDLMLSTHTNKGYLEILPPVLVNEAAMFGTGQLPKFEQDMFRCQDDALYLAPTAEVPVTNLYANEILNEEQLPLWMTAYTPCFRREAGSAGRDTRGLTRVHQFNKVELVKLVHPKTSRVEHQKLLADAEAILQILQLPYRIVELCTGDIGFSAAKCYDIEVWMPSQGCYREISSCSNFGDFQARRANIKYRDTETGKPQFVHTLNGSGLAVGRTMAAILENYQTPSGVVMIPDALKCYFNGLSEFGATNRNGIPTNV